MGKRGTSAKIQAISGSIQRISLSFAGGPVAVQVSGDPDPANNGLFHIYADHLGSTGSLSDSSGVYIPNSHAKYTPFGDWRTEPTATAGDRYYTGHKHNNLGGGADDLGLIYMNARYYLPNTNRMVSPDTIVPDPNNPQNFNRFSYSLNNPINFVDPSGNSTCSSSDQHASCEVQTPSDFPEQYAYSEIYGWFDESHIGDWWWFIEILYETVGKKGGSETVLRDACLVSCDLAHFTAKYWVSGSITRDDVAGVGLGIIMDLERRWEDWQGAVLLGNSSYAIEDFPSDYLGYYSSLSGREPMEVIRSEFGPVNWYGENSPPPGDHLDAVHVQIFDGRRLDFECCFQEQRNDEFLPGGGSSSSWTSNMRLPSIPSSSGLWQHRRTDSQGVWASKRYNTDVTPRGYRLE